MNDMRSAGPDDIKKKAFSDSVCVFDKLRRCAIAGRLISNGRGMKRARKDLRSSGVCKEVFSYGTDEWGFCNEGGLYAGTFS